MEIIGKHDMWLIWKCGKGFYHTGFLYSSGCGFCEHCDGSTYYDYLNVSNLKEITDENIIKQINIQ